MGDKERTKGEEIGQKGGGKKVTVKLQNGEIGGRGIKPRETGIRLEGKDREGERTKKTSSVSPVSKNIFLGGVLLEEIVRLGA